MNERVAILVSLFTILIVVSSSLAPVPQGFSPREKKEMKERVRNIFFHAWDAYLAYGFPSDELQPLECKGRFHKTRGFMDDILGHFCLTVVDSLDTFATLGEWDEFENALNLVEKNVSFGNAEVVSVFETTIRILGGLLSAHILAHDHSSQLRNGYNGHLLDRAIEVGNRLLPAFNTPTGIPCARVHLVNGAHCDSNEVTTAEAGTLILEFGILSKLSGRNEFRKAADLALDSLWKHRTAKNMLGTTINVKTGVWVNIASSIGAGMDSFFEYLLKAYILFGDKHYLDMFWKAYSAVLTYQKQGAFYYSVHAGTGEVVSDSMQNLAMFWPALQVLVGDIDLALEYYTLHANIVSNLGFPPESFFLRNGKIILSDSGYALRPEFVESTLFLYRATKDPVFLLLGKEIVQALENHCRISCGFAAIGDLPTMKLQDRLDTFFFSETLKYLYLLFDDDNFVLKTPHLFTTQAHIIPLTSSLLSNDISERSLPSVSFMSQCTARNGFDSQTTATLLDALDPILSKYSSFMENNGDLILNIQSAKFGELNVKAMVSSFGPSIPSLGIEGNISIASPILGCFKTNNKNKPIIFNGTFGLVRRGSCWFSEKVLNIQQAGGIVAIISDNITQSLFTMICNAGDEKSVKIPSILISKESGDRIASWMSLGESLQAKLIKSTPNKTQK